MTLKYSRIERNGKLPPEPFYASKGAAGIDLSAFEEAEILPNTHKIVGTGLCVAVPDGYVGLIFVRSSLGIKRGITLSNSVGVIDSDYRGELLISLHNTSDETQKIAEGERIAQLTIVPCPHFCIKEEPLDKTERNEGRFGSTGAF